MGRTSIILTPDQEELVRRRARTEGVTKAELIRRIVEAGLSEPVAKRRRVSAGPVPGPLSEIDDWPPWLTKVR